jgi:hypothetical protein
MDTSIGKRLLDVRSCTPMLNAEWVVSFIPKCPAA